MVVLNACAANQRPSPSALNPRGQGSGIQVRLSIAYYNAVAGQPIQGTLAIINTTGTSVPISCGLSSWLTIGLQNGEVAFHAAFNLPVCMSQAVLKPGTTKLPISIPTTYSQCTESGPAATRAPRCVQSPGKPHSGSLPPLPAGRYRTVVVLDGPTYRGFVLPASLEVTIRH